MKYCRFQLNGQAHYGLVEPVAGRDSIVRILLTPPEEADSDMESLRTRKIEAIPLAEAALLPAVRPSSGSIPRESVHVICPRMRKSVSNCDPWPKCFKAKNGTIVLRSIQNCCCHWQM